MREHRRGLVSFSVLGILLVSLTIAPAAFSKTQDWGGFEDWDPMGGGAIGGNFYSCHANGAWGQYCYGVVDVYNSATDTYVRKCGRVSYSASCKCELQTLKTTGICSWRER
jgi:hypothetical protein